MNKLLSLLVLCVFVALVRTQYSDGCTAPEGVTIVDCFFPHTAQVELTHDLTQVFSSTSSPNILGGERDIVITGNGQGNANLITAAYVDTVVAADGQTLDCFVAENPPIEGRVSTLQIDGTDNSASLDTNGLGGLNLNNLGYAFVITAYSDLDCTIRVNVHDGGSTVFRDFSLNGQGGNVIFTDFILPFASFTGDTSVFNSVGAIEVVFPAQANLDVNVALFDIIGLDLFGRVFSDCNCNLVQENGDDGVSGRTITLSPSAGCSTSSSRTAVSGSDGRFSFTGLEDCDYTVSYSNSGELCSNSPASQTVNPDTIVGEVQFSLEAAGSVSIPPDTTITCLENPDDLDLTGRCQVTTGCGVPGNGDCTYTDQVVPVNDGCDGTRIIERSWTVVGSDLQAEIQIINVIDSGVAATISAPDDMTISCTQSSDPSVTGQPNAFDDCSVPSTSFFDDIVDQCNRDTCTRTETITRRWVADDGCNNTPLNEDIQIITRQSCDAGPVTCPSPILISRECPDYLDDDVARYYDYDDADDDRLGNLLDDDDVCQCQVSRDSSDATSLSVSFVFLALFSVFFI